MLVPAPGFSSTSPSSGLLCSCVCQWRLLESDTVHHCFCILKHRWEFIIFIRFLLCPHGVHCVSVIIQRTHTEVVLEDEVWLQEEKLVFQILTNLDLMVADERVKNTEKRTGARNMILLGLKTVNLCHHQTLSTQKYQKHFRRRNYVTTE